MKRLIYKLLGILVIAASVGGGWFWLDIKNFSDRPINTDGMTVMFEVPAGNGFFKVAYDLQRAGIIESAKKFLWMLRLQNKVGEIKKGEYELTSDLNSSKLADMFIAGKVKQYSLTIVEGWTFKQLLAELTNHPRIVQTLNGVTPVQIAMQLGIEANNPEGYFLPDTYLYTANTTDLEMLKRMNKALTTTLDREWQTRSANLPYATPYEALIMASIVEKETGAAVERGEIAGVFVRRLQKNMRLQTDPTVIYGMGDRYKGNVRKKDLLEDTAYNTYTRRGLPPTPISLAGRDAIHAALNPTPGESLFFVAKGDGSHYFSATIEEHNQAVQRFQVKQRTKQYRSAPQTVLN